MLFLCHFGLKMVIHFAHLGMESGMGFEGVMGVYECKLLLLQLQVNKKERVICEFKIGSHFLV